MAILEEESGHEHIASISMIEEDFIDIVVVDKEEFISINK